MLTKSFEQDFDTHITLGKKCLGIEVFLIVRNILIIIMCLGIFHFYLPLSAKM